ncbi:alkaline phosphatase PafA [Aureibacter tunicatorum]|uniref:glycerophosphocholine cholinephosphodiesterase n=1 Tax=Aureibacter tunicatorum TaxID=866807 RepID=A0AAE4BST6_9BACT|nr:alkaline phosphatase PafA [Aureibacter tunicatorum]MDR6238767.1 putative AlkP superfamily pyrophosphatase or phosphodiesterase [Aureibacter tunicatorum]BDD05302.1 alkaline phosphatase family protein [Aureibacter tunicatorum]
MKKIIAGAFIALLPLATWAQEKKTKLVVGVVVDQMRHEYLKRFEEHFSEDGFKRLQREGFSVENMHYNYMPTTTGPGHASIYTGTSPAYHGIVYNEWYDRNNNKVEYCVEDSTVRLIGNGNEKKYKRSPVNLLTTTITDELEMCTGFESKVIGIAIKDRSAVLSAGHNPDGAYWYDGDSKEFVSSSYYMEDLPKWLKKFNNKKLPDSYAKKQWTPLLSLDKYVNSRQDDAWYEDGYDGHKFPHHVEEEHGKRNFISDTPFGNDLIFDLAKESIEAEQLGRNEVTDFLAINFSSTDMIGHAFGPYSMEVEDAYIRLDQNIADLLKYLDEKIGEGEYLVFLTADHGGSEVPAYLQEKKMPGGYFDKENCVKQINDFLNQQYTVEEQWIDYIDFFQINLNNALLKKLNLRKEEVNQQVVELLEKRKEIARAFTADRINLTDYSAGGYKGMLSRSYFPKRSGDVFYCLQSGWLYRSSRKGTSHGSPYVYDTHVPSIWFGNGVKQGKSWDKKEITDIAPTISALLGIKFPSGTTGSPIKELLHD